MHLCRSFTQGARDYADQGLDAKEGGMTRLNTPGQTQLRKERVFLTGFMGSGKSTIGPILANTIGYEFVDLDRSIEEVEKESVSMIFRDHGEEYFRSRERTMLAKACGMMHVVVALGGGTLADEQNLQLVHASGVLVYLKLSREQVFLRLRRRNDRPLLSGPDGMPLDDKQLHKRIEDLYEAREPLYATADLTVQTDESRLGLTVDSLVRQLTPLLG